MTNARLALRGAQGRLLPRAVAAPAPSQAAFLRLSPIPM